jgi:oxygen-independent coproporphyrinogen-3 oxidase
MSNRDPELIRRYGGQGPRYTSYPSALQFHEDVNDTDYDDVIRQGNTDQRPLSLYFHIPFCNSVCYYCACNRIITANKARGEPYLDDLEREMDLHAERVDTQRPVVQLHWGGGTPTWLDDAQTTELMFLTGRRFRLLDEGGDYAIEIDPRTVDDGRLGLLRGIGFNRVSLGVQDLDPRVQKAVNRIQPESMIRDRVQEIRDHEYHSLSMDLILGLPCQSEGSLALTLEKIIALGPDRLSLFNYAHLPERFKVQRQINDDALPSPEEKLRMQIRAARMLEEAGYIHVGMDHFAQPDDELARAQRAGTLHRNFQGYTLHGEADLIAMGPSAISQLGELYVQNHKTLQDWENALRAGRLPFERGYRLSRDDRIRRDLIIRLLCDMAIDIPDFEDRWNLDFNQYFRDEQPRLNELAAEGLLDIHENGFRLTETGCTFARAVAMVFDRYLSAPESSRRFSRIL